MKFKRLFTFLTLPLLLGSCAQNTTFDKVKEMIDSIDSSAKNPYYRVAGYLDFNNEVMEIDSVFDKTPSVDSFVPYARYNDGFYCPSASTSEKACGKENTVIYSMASSSYFLRAPLRLHKNNFYVVGEDGKENPTCGHYIIEHIITSYKGADGAVNPSTNNMKFEVLKDGGFAFIGQASHTLFRLDNYPFYPDVNTHPEIGEWNSNYPLPCYGNQINAKVNVRFEYNKDGWLVREFLKTTDYDYNTASQSQISLETVYSYKFE